MKRFRLEAAGWGFWTVCFVLLLGPSIYVFWLYKSEEANFMAPIAGGALVSALGAAIISITVNRVLQIREQRRRESGQHRAKPKPPAEPSTKASAPHAKPANPKPANPKRRKSGKKPAGKKGRRK